MTSSVPNTAIDYAEESTAIVEPEIRVAFMQSYSIVLNATGSAAPFVLDHPIGTNTVHLNSPLVTFSTFPPRFTLNEAGTYLFEVGPCRAQMGGATAANFRIREAAEPDSVAGSVDFTLNAHLGVGEFAMSHFTHKRVITAVAGETYNLRLVKTAGGVGDHCCVFGDVNIKISKLT